LIDVQGLRKSYQGRLALEDVSFQVPRGQVLGLLGPNGAGKSSTMRILTGYLGADSGSARIAGFDVFTQSLEVRRRVGYLPESAPLYSEMRVQPFLDLLCRLRGVPRARRQDRIDFALSACGLTDRRFQIIGQLSRGLRQRVALAQAVVHDPPVLILDEPTAGLDPGQTRETRDLIVELGHSHTVIMSSHILSEVSATCQRVVIINRGRLVADGSPADLGAALSGGARELEMVVAGDGERLRAALAPVVDAERIRIEDLAAGEHRVSIREGSDELQDQLTAAVLGAGLRLRSLALGAPSLERVYLELTQGESGSDAEPEPGPDVEPGPQSLEQED